MRKVIVLCAVALAIPAFAKIEMGAPFTDGVVLQRGCAVPVWGWATPNASVTVSFAGEKAVTTARADGSWRLSLPAMEASKEGRTMTVAEATSGWIFDDVTDTVEVKDILVGEVWFASGQSNMDFAIWNSHARYRDFAGGLVTEMTQLPCVRFVKTPKTWSVEPPVGEVDEDDAGNVPERTAGFGSRLLLCARTLSGAGRADRHRRFKLGWHEHRRVDAALRVCGLRSVHRRNGCISRQEELECGDRQKVSDHGCAPAADGSLQCHG